MGKSQSKKKLLDKKEERIVWDIESLEGMRIEAATIVISSGTLKTSDGRVIDGITIISLNGRSLSGPRNTEGVKLRVEMVDDVITKLYKM